MEAGQKIAVVESTSISRTLAELAVEKARLDTRIAAIEARQAAVGVLLPAATFVGWLIGHLLDLHFHTNWIYLVGLGFGIAAGFVQFFRVALKAGND